MSTYRECIALPDSLRGRPLDISLRGSILRKAAVVRLSTLRCMPSAVFAELMLQNIEILST